MGRLSASDRVSDHRPKELELAHCTSIPPPMQSLTIPPQAAAQLTWRGKKERERGHHTKM